jgi:hypothetical protein
LPEPLFFDPSLPAHRTRAAGGGIKNGTRDSLEVAILPRRGTKRRQIEFQVVGSITLFEKAMEFAV